MDFKNYIKFLKDNTHKYGVELNVTNEMDMFKSYRWGWAIGFSDGGGGSRKVQSQNIKSINT